MALPSAIPSFLTGFRMPQGSALQAITDLNNSIQSQMTALAGGGKPNAITQTAYVVNSANVEVSVCATNNDSILLPPGIPGMRICIANAGAATLKVYGANSDLINDVANATGVSQTTGQSALYFCTSKSAAGVAKWYRNLSA